MTPTQFVKMVATLHWDGEEVNGELFNLPNDDMYDSYVFLIQQAREIVKERKR